MRAGAPLFALALSGRAAAAFVQGGVGGAPAAAAPGRPLAAAGPPPAAEEAGAEDASARPRLVLGLLGFALGLAAAGGKASAKQPFQTDRDCPFGDSWYDPAKRNPCRNDKRAQTAPPRPWSDYKDASPGRLKRPTADSGPAFMYGPDSEFSSGFNMGEKIMNKNGDADGPETRFWSRRPDKIAAKGGYFNYMGMADDANDPKRKIRSPGANWKYLTQEEGASEADINKYFGRIERPDWGVKRKP